MSSFQSRKMNKINQDSLDSTEIKIRIHFNDSSIRKRIIIKLRSSYRDTFWFVFAHFCENKESFNNLLMIFESLKGFRIRRECSWYTIRSFMGIWWNWLKKIYQKREDEKWIPVIIEDEKITGMKEWKKLTLFVCIVIINMRRMNIRICCILILYYAYWPITILYYLLLQYY